MTSLPSFSAAATSAASAACAAGAIGRTAAAASAIAAASTLRRDALQELRMLVICIASSLDGTSNRSSVSLDLLNKVQMARGNVEREHVAFHEPLVAARHHRLHAECRVHAQL